MTFGEIVELLGFPYVPTEDKPVRRFRRKGWPDGKLCGIRHDWADYKVNGFESMKIAHFECICDENLTRTDFDATDWEFYE